MFRSPSDNCLSNLVSAFYYDHPPDSRLFEGCDPNDLLSAADFHALSSFIYYMVQRHQMSVDESMSKTLKQKGRNAAIFYELAIGTLKAIRKELDPENRMVLMQGMAIMDAMPPDGWVRQMGDIDIHLPDGKPPELDKILKDLGFKPWLNYSDVWIKDRISLDFHEDLWGEKRIPQRKHLFPNTSPSFIPSGQIPGMLMPDLEHLYRHTVFHMVKHSFSRLLWDIDLILMERKFTASDQQPNLEPRPKSVITSRRSFVLHGVIEEKSLMRRKLLRFLFENPYQEGISAMATPLLSSSYCKALTLFLSAIFPRKSVLKEMYGNKPMLLLICIRAMKLLGMLSALVFSRRSRR